MELHTLQLSMAAVFVIRQGGRTLLVDCGTARDFLRLQAWLEQNRWRPDLLFLTHVHVDHAGGVSQAQRVWGMPVACPAKESDWATNGVRRVPPAQEAWALPLVWLGALIPFPRLPAFQPDLLFEEAFDFASHGFEAQVLPTPGHSPGHVSLVLPDGRLLAGDAVAGAPRKRDDPRLSCFGEDRAAMVESVRRMADLRPSEVLPSHGSLISGSALCDWAAKLSV